MRAACLLLATAVITLPLAAHADGTLLEQADHAMDDLDFDLAAKLYQQALRQPGTTAERARTYRGLGLAKAFVGKAKAAQRNFEVMLLIDPEATVNASLGPKISRPFEAAKRAVRVRRQQPELTLQRDPRSGEVTAQVTHAVDPIVQVELHVVADGAEQRATVTVPKPATLSFEPYVDVKAWAAAIDDGGGAILTRGEGAKPLEFPATARPPLAVVAAVDEANKQKISSQEEAASAPAVQTVEESGGARWPFIVGGAVMALAGGAAAAYFLSTPEPLHLPAADHTGRLP